MTKLIRAFSLAAFAAMAALAAIETWWPKNVATGYGELIESNRGALAELKVAPSARAEKPLILGSSCYMGSSGKFSKNSTEVRHDNTDATDLYEQSQLKACLA